MTPDWSPATALTVSCPLALMNDACHFPSIDMKYLLGGLVLALEWKLTGCGVDAARQDLSSGEV